MATFADGLTAIIAQKREESRERENIAQRWRDHEDALLEVAVEKFKARCMKEAEMQKGSAIVSFEVLAREIPSFPKHVVKDGAYIVDSWGDASAEWWFYATKGTKNEFPSKSPVLYAEVLESMMAQFVEFAKVLGFDSCRREPGTWKVKAAWSLPGSSEKKEEEAKPSKQAKTDAIEVKEARAAPGSPAHTKTPTPTDCPSSDDELCNALDMELKKGK